VLTLKRRAGRGPLRLQPGVALFFVGGGSSFGVSPPATCSRGAGLVRCSSGAFAPPIRWEIDAEARPYRVEFLRAHRPRYPQYPQGWETKDPLLALSVFV
jgi:hypothetical protein